MNKDTNRDVKVEVITGEVYYVHTDHLDNKTDSRFQGIAVLLSKRIDDYFDRLSSLRAYDNRRVDG